MPGFCCDWLWLDSHKLSFSPNLAACSSLPLGNILQLRRLGCNVIAFFLGSTYRKQHHFTANPEGDEPDTSPALSRIITPLLRRSLPSPLPFMRPLLSESIAGVFLSNLGQETNAKENPFFPHPGSKTAFLLRPSLDILLHETLAVWSS